jgi:iron complex outermembrane recepter protein
MAALFTFRPRDIARIAPPLALGLTALALSLAPVPVLAQQRASGTVTDAVQGSPVSTALITLADPRRIAVTDREGRFDLGELPTGRYTITVEALGYRIATVETAFPGGVAVILEPSALRISGVTATATPLRGSGVYQPSSALNQEQLQRRAAVGIGDVIDGQPGVTVRSFGPAPSRPVIRGLDGDRVVMLQNGEKTGDLSETAADHAVSIDPLGVERIEVVRGPASLLYGSSALGGVVNILDRSVPTDWRPGLAGGAAFHGATVNDLLEGSAGAVYGTESWAVTGRGTLRDSDDLRTPGGVLAGSYTRLASGSTGAGVRTANGTAGVAVTLLDHTYGLPDDVDDPREGVLINMERWNVQGRGQWQLPGFIQEVELRGNGGGYFHEEVASALNEDDAIEEDVALDFRTRSLNSSLVMRHGSVGRIAQGAFGLSFQWRDLFNGGDEALSPDGRSLALAGYLFEEIPLRPGVRAQVGLRSELQRLNAISNDRFSPDRGNFTDETRTTVTLAGSMGLHIRPTDEWEVGVQFARAHRAPLVEESFANAAHLSAGTYEIGDPSLKNEIGYGLDVVSRWGSARTQTEVAVFFNQINDFVVLRPTNEIDQRTGYPILRYAGTDARIYGGEASVEFTPTRTVTLGATADLVRAEERDGTRTPLPAIPPARLMLEGRLDPGTWWGGASARFVARQGEVAPEEEDTDGYLLLGLETGVRILDGRGRGGQSIVLRVENLLDAEYRDHLSRVESRALPMPGRNIKLVYRWTF